MSHRLYFWFLYSAIMLVAIGLAFRGWSSLQHANVIVEWTTASEMETAGFYLYRSLTPDGSYERVNEYLIPGSPDPLTGGSYRFEDDSVLPGRIYYYLLEDVEFDGDASRSGPIEVKAQRGGVVELLLAVVLLSAAVFGIRMRRRAVLLK